MARSSYQKLKPLYVKDFLLRNTDEEHPATVNQIIAYLKTQGISAERKSIVMRSLIERFLIEKHALRWRSFSGKTTWNNVALMQVVLPQSKSC